jgi:2-aminoadipate transaminase
MSESRGPVLTAGRLGRASSSPVREILALTERPGVVSFAGGLPAPELFDVAGLREAFATVLGDECAGRALQYSTTEGDPALRSVIAERLTARGLDTEAQDLLITSGSQQALTLVAAVLLEPGDRVLVEEPSYLAALQCFALARAVAVPVPCDDEGLTQMPLTSWSPSIARSCSTPCRRFTIRRAGRCRWLAGGRSRPPSSALACG